MLRRVLLIDDDRAQFRLTAAHLKHFTQATYELDWADSYETGLQKLSTGDYVACLLDYQLGPRDGLQLIREATHAGVHTPIVFLTAETSTQIDIEAMNAGALDYLVKGDITPHVLERSLRYAVKLNETLDALRLLATRDELTGLLNRREFDRLALEEQERSLRFGQPVSLLMIDVDHFKAINDTHGHPAGDAALHAVAERIVAGVRNVDRVFRYGGEEFAVLLVQTDHEAARSAAERVRTSFVTQPIVAADTVRLNLTISIGLATLPRNATSAAELIKAADQALYAAKAGGRNRTEAAIASRE